MNTNYFKTIFMLIVLASFSIYQVQAQTKGSGAMTNTCTAVANDGGVPGNTSVGCGAGGSAMTGSDNTSIGEVAGTNLTSGDANTFLGDSCGYSNTTGYDNTFMGFRSGKKNTIGYYNAFLGDQAGYHNTGSCRNVAVGYTALFTQSYNGDRLYGYNVAVGTEALYTNNPTTSSNGVKNTAIGDVALFSNTVGRENTASGYGAGYSNTTGESNTFTGYESGAANTTASGNTFTGAYSGIAVTTGGYNAFAGFESGKTSTTANYNTFTGYQSGKGNTTGYSNTFIGCYNGVSNNTGYRNTYLGYAAGNQSTNPTENTFLGAYAGYSNTTAGYNTFTGNRAGFNNTTGAYNSFNGDFAGTGNTTGSNNTALGYYAGFTTTTGDSNTFVGSYANANGAGAYHNCAAIGYGALALTSNKFYFGNSVTECRTTSWVSTSDGRFKFNIQENVKGLDFIKKLRPVTYQLNTQQLDAFMRQNMPQQTDSSGNPITMPAGDFSKSMSIVHSGFIAQEVDSVANVCGFTSSIVSKPANSNDTYGLAYGEIVVPLVKAVQELSNKVDSLLAITNPPSNGRVMNNSGNQSGNENTQEVKLKLPIEISMSEARPNPNDGNAEIDYYLPSSVSNAKIIFTDMLGNVINEVQLSIGYGTIVVDTQDLPNGTYTFSLITDGNVYNTKKMLRNK